MFLRFINIINICTILLSTVGITSYRHYCQDKLKAVSFFADLIEPCCKSSKKTKQKIPKKSSCCSQKKTCSVTNQGLALAVQPVQKCCSKTKQKKEKTVFKKRSCCLDKSSYAQSDILSFFDVESDIVGFTPITIFPVLQFVEAPAFTLLVAGNQKLYYPFIDYPPPSKIPLYIAHQAFLC